MSDGVIGWEAVPIPQRKVHEYSCKQAGECDEQYPGAESPQPASRHSEDPGNQKCGDQTDGELDRERFAKIEFKARAVDQDAGRASMGFLIPLLLSSPLLFFGHSWRHGDPREKIKAGIVDRAAHYFQYRILRWQTANSGFCHSCGHMPDAEHREHGNSTHQPAEKNLPAHDTS